jgi:hypothetical protein
MKANERRSIETAIAIYKRLLVRVNNLGPESESPEHIEAFGQIKDYLLEVIERYEIRLEDALRISRETRGRKPSFLRLKKNSLLPPPRARHNGFSSGVKNG